MKRYVLTLATSALLFGCNSAQKETDKALTEPAPATVAAAQQVGTPNVAEVNFDRGSFVLTEGSRAALSDLVAKAKAQGEVKDISVLAWADNSYPSNSKKKLSKAERDLAGRRATSISDFLKAERLASNVDTYNMAERPNAIERLFNTSDARVKNAFENAGVTSSDGKSLSGKASRAVVLVMPKD